MNLLDKLRKRLSMTGREFWLSFDGAVGDQGFVHYENPNYESQIHVTEKTDRAELDGALLKCVEALADIMKAHEINYPAAPAVKAMAELSRALDKTEAG